MLVDYTNKKAMVLLNDSAMQRAAQLGTTVARAMKGEEKGPGVVGTCPGCGNSLINFENAPNVSCAMCGAKAVLNVVDGHPVIEFADDCVEMNRFTAKGFAAHLKEVDHCHKIAEAGKFLIETRLEAYRNYGKVIHP